MSHPAVQVLLSVAVFGFVLTGCAEKPVLPSGGLTLQAVTFHELRGWQEDRQEKVMPAFRRSCEALAKKDPETRWEAGNLTGQIHDWLPVCAALENQPPRTTAESRRFLETWLTPYAVRQTPDGRFTGYYEAEIKGAYRQTGAYQTPLWQRPADLVTVDLGAFRAEWHGKKIMGKREGKNFVPYDDRAAITAGSLLNRAHPLVWTDDPVAAFFLEIQGSGRVCLPDGQKVRIGYDAQNGKDYVPIGRVLVDEGSLEKPVTMDKIKVWLKAHPDRAQAVMNKNPSVVFFREIVGEGPVGAQGVVLTPERSLAVDPVFVPLGTPLWLDLKQNEPGAVPVPRLVIAQDTGGAIKGPVRGDLFWGAGPEAEAQAGTMQSHGTYYLLLPRTVRPHAAR